MLTGVHIFTVGTDWGFEHEPIQYTGLLAWSKALDKGRAFADILRKTTGKKEDDL